MKATFAGLVVASLLATSTIASAEAAGTVSIASAEQAIAAQGFSASRLDALGQAQLQAGQLGPAVASFERGLLLAPRNAKLKTDLQHAREKAGLPQAEHHTWLAKAVHELSLREWALAAFASTLFFALALLGMGIAKQRRRGFRVLLCVAAAAAAFTLVGVVLSQPDLKRAYVLQDESPVRQSPFAAAETIAHLRAGEAVEQQERHGAFVYVQSDEGVHGWVASDTLAPLAATAPTRS